MLKKQPSHLPNPSAPRRAISPGDCFLISHASPGGSGRVALYCAHRTTIIHLSDPSKLARLLSWNGARAGPTAAVERAHSDRARSGSKGSAQVSFHSFYRARSASKKGTWLLPPHSSETARCASTGD